MRIFPLQLVCEDSVPASPLPTQVCEGDEIHVEVQNQLPSGGVSLHWHGLVPSPFMDGSPGLAQALLPPRRVFQYKLGADNPGTHYWHALAGNALLLARPGR